MLRRPLLALTLALAAGAARGQEAPSTPAPLSRSECGAAACLRIVHWAQGVFRDDDLDRNGKHDFAPDLATLAAKGLIDPELGRGTRFGYRFTLRRSATRPEAAWTCLASPATPDAGTRHFAATQEHDRPVQGAAAFQANDDGALPADAPPVESTRPAGAARGLKAGQRWVLRITQGQERMRMVLHVKQVEGDVVTFDRQFQTEQGMAAGEPIQEVMDLRRSDVPLTIATEAYMERNDMLGSYGELLRQDRLTVGETTVECLVFSRPGKLERWVAVSPGGWPTFPLHVRIVREGQLFTDLIAVEEPAR